MKKIVESVKVVYFTIFYTAVMRPMAMTEDLKEQLTHYLLMEEAGTTLAKAPSPPEEVKPPVPKHPVEKKEAVDPRIAQLAEYFERYINSGYSEQEIKEFLLSKGYPEEALNSALAYLKSRE